MGSKYLAYFPTGTDPSRVKACLGLISDTHVPVFCTSLPPILHEIFKDVSLILHAGDIGDRCVLDELSTIAPVVAIQGNDIHTVVDRLLPLRAILTISGQRILLFHSHHPDLSVEMKTRQEDRWSPKLGERIAAGKEVGASIVVFGHTHIPMTYHHGGGVLINPGAIAPGSAIARQTCKTVALLFLMDDALPLVVHVDLTAPQQGFIPTLDWDQGFQAALSQVAASLIDPDLEKSWGPIEKYLRNLMGNPPYSSEFGVLYEALLQISRRCWSGEQQFITRIDLKNMFDDPTLVQSVSPQIIIDLRKLLD